MIDRVDKLPEASEISAIEVESQSGEICKLWFTGFLGQHANLFDSP